MKAADIPSDNKAPPVPAALLADAGAQAVVGDDEWGAKLESKARSIADAWRKAITDGDHRLYRRQSDFFNDLATAIRTYKDTGRVDNSQQSGRLFNAIRPGPLSICRSQEVKTVAGRKVLVPAAKEVVRHALPWTDKLRFLEPFPLLVGPQPTVVLAEFTEPDPNSRWVSFLGEAYVYILMGQLTIEWLVPADNNKDGRFKKASFLLRADTHPHYRGAWMKTECAHRILLNGSGPALALIYYSDPGHKLFAPSNRGRSAVSTSGSKNDRRRKVRNAPKPGGLRPVELSGLEDPRLWQIFSGIGARIERVRMERGLTTTELALMCSTTAGHIGRIENGFLAPSIETAANIAARLNTPLSDILPDDVLTFTKGCYVNSAEPVWEACTSKAMPPETKDFLKREREQRFARDRRAGRTLGEKPDYRVQIPYLWTDYGDLLVLPSGSPRAKALTPLILHIGVRPHPSQIHGRYFENVKNIASANYSAIVNRDSNFYRSFSGTLVLYVRHGEVVVHVARYADYHLTPFSMLQSESRVPSEQFGSVTLAEGDLIHLNCEHMHRLEVVNEVHCALLCVLARRRPTQALAIPKSTTLRSVLPVRSLDATFADYLELACKDSQHIHPNKSK